MALPIPIHDVTRPAALAGQANGQLPDRILVSVPGQLGGPVVRLVEPAARGWRAMSAGALAAGHTLKATAVADSYRSYAVQESLFRARYSTTKIPNRPTKTWQGRTWWLRPGMATAAVPGTSNHGWGLAVDIGNELDGDAGTESIDNATVAWLAAHAAEYGYSAELQEEPWHWRYWSGDTIPPAVLRYEQSQSQQQEEEEDDMATKLPFGPLDVLTWVLKNPDAKEGTREAKDGGVWAIRDGQCWYVGDTSLYEQVYAASEQPWTLPKTFTTWAGLHGMAPTELVAAPAKPGDIDSAQRAALIAAARAIVAAADAA